MGGNQLLTKKIVIPLISVAAPNAGDDSAILKWKVKILKNRSICYVKYILKIMIKFVGLNELINVIFDRTQGNKQEVFRPDCPLLLLSGNQV